EADSEDLLAALRRLQTVGPAAEPILKQIAADAERHSRDRMDDRSRKTRFRAESLLHQLKKPADTGMSLDPTAIIRSLAALEQIGTPPAGQVLEEVSRGQPRSVLTREAKAALDRLRNRQADQPPK